MRWNAGVLAGLLIGSAWLIIGLTVVLVARGRRRSGVSTGGSAVIGIFLMVVAGLTLFATLLLSVVPGAD
ncbi:MAG: hypothetical protein L0H25_08620 [Micrococcales bacterium]|nr:hypothetical protein [Micrococcales bacterium]